MYETLPEVKISPEKVADVKVNEFEEMNKKMEEMALEMQRKDEEWRAEKARLEAQRAEDARKIQELINNQGKKRRKWYKF